MKFGERLKGFFKGEFFKKQELSEEPEEKVEPPPPPQPQLEPEPEPEPEPAQQPAPKPEPVPVPAPKPQPEPEPQPQPQPQPKPEPVLQPQLEPQPKPQPTPPPPIVKTERPKVRATDELFDDLCDILIEGDIGAAEGYRITEALRAKCKKETVDVVHLKLAELLEEELKKAKPAGKVFSLEQKEFAAILILGVNGVGKTTTAAKLAHFFKTQYNKKTILAAADTFRAAAIDQLKIHGQKLDMRVIAHKQGGDPAAVVYDALEAALSSGADAVIADTAGRMHTKTSLVEELRKIDRVVESKGASRYLKYLILDATTGRNAYAQAEIFHEAVNLDGVILTKYDSTAKGGIVFSLASGLNLPVAYICTGEKYDDIDHFDPGRFVKEFTGIE